MVGAAEQKAVLPPINWMEPTHQFPILTLFLNRVRLKPCGVKPQELDVKNSMLLAHCGGNVHVQIRLQQGPAFRQNLSLPNVTVQSNRWSYRSLSLHSGEHLHPQTASHILGAAAHPQDCRLIPKDGCCSLGRAHHPGGGFGGCAVLLHSIFVVRPQQCPQHLMVWLVHSLTQAEAPMRCRVHLNIK